ncbi:unnamed protein product [Oncorhynchus mykiss]|uniref:Sushi domain-containing protein n=1 Tax=Oncorhynchus mykiss TaxID=8022 RepID=A0A060XA67_ONCMY|nr:unnamed protein product [Oncorhynchus mykiss]
MNISNKSILYIYSKRLLFCFCNSHLHCPSPALPRSVVCVRASPEAGVVLCRAWDGGVGGYSAGLLGYQLVGSDKISCSVRAGKAQWSNFLPVCEAIPRPEDRGLRVAVLASVVSGIVILAMSLSFIICCLQERTGKDRGSRRDGRIRRRDTRSSRRSECWLEREEGDWDTFPPPKIFHLSQRPDLRLAAESPVYLGGMAGFDNRGYLRSQESLLKATLPGLFRTESQIIYPHVVLQRVPTPTAPTAPTAPVYLHNMPSNSASNSGCAPTQPHHMPPYPTPQYPIHNSTPQRSSEYSEFMNISSPPTQPIFSNFLVVSHERKSNFLKCLAFISQNNIMADIFVTQKAILHGNQNDSSGPFNDIRRHFSKVHPLFTPRFVLKLWMKNVESSLPVVEVFVVCFSTVVEQSHQLTCTLWILLTGWQ